MKILKEYIFEELENVIIKVRDYWASIIDYWLIKGNIDKGTNTPKHGYWKVKYKTKEKSDATLKAYFANK